MPPPYSLLEKISLSRDREKTKPDKLKRPKKGCNYQIAFISYFAVVFLEKNLGKDERKYFVKILTVFDYKVD